MGSAWSMAMVILSENSKSQVWECVWGWWWAGCWGKGSLEALGLPHPRFPGPRTVKSWIHWFIAFFSLLQEGSQVPNLVHETGSDAILPLCQGRAGKPHPTPQPFGGGLMWECPFLESISFLLQGERELTGPGLGLTWVGLTGWDCRSVCPAVAHEPQSVSGWHCSMCHHGAKTVHKPSTVPTLWPAIHKASIRVYVAREPVPNLFCFGARGRGGLGYAAYNQPWADFKLWISTLQLGDYIFHC